MSKKLRLGIIGCGEIAVAHAVGISKTTNAGISMTMDVNFALAKDLGDEYTRKKPKKCILA